METYTYIHMERIPVSIRVPSPIAEAVNTFAEEHNLRKTDAYLHLIQRGLEAETSSRNE